MNIEVVEVGMFGVNCYILWEAPGTAALVLDPGADAAKIEKALYAHGLGVSAYLVTHGHVDHVGALAELHAARPAPIAMSATDAAWAFGPDNRALPFYPAPRPPGNIACSAEDGLELDYGGLRCRVIGAPGHTPGGVCFYFEESAALFTGDTLFEGTVGRTDLPGGDEAVLRASLAKLACLPDATRVFPGHGVSTTIRREREANPFLAR